MSTIRQGATANRKHASRFGRHSLTAIIASISATPLFLTFLLVHTIILGPMLCPESDAWGPCVDLRGVGMDFIAYATIGLSASIVAGVFAYKAFCAKEREAILAICVTIGAVFVYIAVPVFS